MLKNKDDLEAVRFAAQMINDSSRQKSAFTFPGGKGLISHSCSYFLSYWSVRGVALRSLVSLKGNYAYLTKAKRLRRDE